MMTVSPCIYHEQNSMRQPDMVTNRIRCKSSASQIYMFIDIALYLTLAEVTKNSTRFANTSVASHY